LILKSSIYIPERKVRLWETQNKKFNYHKDADEASYIDYVNDVNNYIIKPTSIIPKRTRNDDIGIRMKYVDGVKIKTIAVHILHSARANKIRE
jgi:hypothetical protein